METFAEKLYIALHTLLPEDWDKLVFRGILAPGSCEFYFWCLTPEGYLGSRDLIKAGVFTQSELNAAYNNVRKLARAEQNSTGGDKWCGFTFMLNSDAGFSFDYEYDSEAPDSYEVWKAKYLT